MVTTSDGMPDQRHHEAVEETRAARPRARAATTPSTTLPVASQTHTKPTMPRAMIEGNERSMSPRR